MTAGNGDGDNSMDIEDVRLAMQEACQQHLEGTRSFPLDALSILCSTYLIVEAYVETIKKQKMPGIRSADFLVRLRTALPDRSKWPEAKLKKMVAKQFGVEVGALTKALQRKAEPKPPKAKKAKRTKQR